MKLDATVDAALALAEVALAAGDRVGLVTYGRTIHRRLAPDRGHPHLRAILDTLATLKPERAEADHAAAAATVLAAQKQRALVVWLTDLSETAASCDLRFPLSVVRCPLSEVRGSGFGVRYSSIGGAPKGLNMAYKAERGTEFCVVVSVDGVTVYGNRAAMRSISKWLAKIAEA